MEVEVMFAGYFKDESRLGEVKINMDQTLSGIYGSFIWMDFKKP